MCPALSIHGDVTDPGRGSVFGDVELEARLIGACMHVLYRRDNGSRCGPQVAAEAQPGGA
jgi:hypothetical protein